MTHSQINPTKVGGIWKMGYKFIKFNRNQEGMEDMFDISLIGFVHICIDSNNDYTLCGHATDEYNISIVDKKPTCRNCIEVVKDCKLIKEVKPNSSHS